MKVRLLTVFALAIGLALSITWVVAGQETESESDIRLVSVAAIDRVENLLSHQDTATLDHPSEITAASEFTIYLPAVIKDHRACSTAPTLLGPANGSSLDTLIPLFQWDNGNDPNPTEVRVEVSKEADFADIDTSMWSDYYPGTHDTRWPWNFDPSTTYYWRAWLLCGDIQGPYSEIWSLTTGSDGAILPAPALVAPADGSTLTSLPATLQWSEIGGAEEYLVHWRKAGQGGYIYRWVTGTQTTLGWPSANTTFEWWVSALNDYAVGADSARWQFTTPAQVSSHSPENWNYGTIVEDGETGMLEYHR